MLEFFTGVKLAQADFWVLLLFSLSLRSCFLQQLIQLPEAKETTSGRNLIVAAAAAVERKLIKNKLYSSFLLLLRFWKKNERFRIICGDVKTRFEEIFFCVSKMSKKELLVLAGKIFKVL